MTKQLLGLMCPEVVTRVIGTTCVPYPLPVLTLELGPSELMSGFLSLQLMYAESPTEW